MTIEKTPDGIYCFRDDVSGDEGYGTTPQEAYRDGTSSADNSPVSLFPVMPTQPKRKPAQKRTAATRARQVPAFMRNLLSLWLGQPFEAKVAGLDWDRLEKAAGVSFNQNQRQRIAACFLTHKHHVETALPVRTAHFPYDDARLTRIKNHAKTLAELLVPDGAEEECAGRYGLGVVWRDGESVRWPSREPLRAMLYDLHRATEIVLRAKRKKAGYDKVSPLLEGLVPVWREAGGQGKACWHTRPDRHKGGLFNLLQELYRQTGMADVTPSGGKIEYALDRLGLND